MTPQRFRQFPLLFSCIERFATKSALSQLRFPKFGRADFIAKFRVAPGQNVTHEKQTNLHQQQTEVERPLTLNSGAGKCRGFHSSLVSAVSVFSSPPSVFSGASFKRSIWRSSERWLDCAKACS